MAGSYGRRRLTGCIAAALVTAVCAATFVLATDPVSAAVDDCGFVGAVNTFDGNGAATGSWTVSANWDADQVPTSGQVCIPAGKTATVPSNTTLAGGGSQALRVQGTLRIVGDPVATTLFSTHTIEVTGRIEVASGAALFVSVSQNSIPVVRNMPGGVVDVEPGGVLVDQGVFDNAGGTVDLTGGGAFTVNHGLARFVQGSAAGGGPTQGTVVGGPVRVANSSVLQSTGTGAGAFEWVVGSLASLEGTLAASQTVSVECDANTSTNLNIASNVTNAGLIRLDRRIGGAVGEACSSIITVGAGSTLTNAGSLLLGESADPASTYTLQGQGSLVNGAGGSVDVRGQVTDQLRFENHADFAIHPSASFNPSNVGFVQQGGTLANDGSMAVVSGLGYFRLLGGDVSGNPIRLIDTFLEPIANVPAAFELVPDHGANLRNPFGAIVVGSQVHITVRDASLTSNAVAFENRGEIVLTGEGDKGSSVGQNGVPWTNRGTITLTSDPATGTGGQNLILGAFANDAGGLVDVYDGRSCSTGSVTNRGTLDVRTGCGGATYTLKEGGTLRVHASSAGFSGLFGVGSSSSVDGALEIVTDVGDPPAAGPPQDIVTSRGPPFNFSVAGTFDSVSGSVSDGLGYGVSYPCCPRKVQAQVVPTSQLTVTTLDAPDAATVGDDVTVTWITNVESATNTSWTESVYLSSGPVVDQSSVLLGRLERTGAVSAGSDLPGSILVRMPSFTTGRRHVVVVADSGSALAIPDRADAIAVTPIELEASALVVGGAGVPVVVGTDGTRSAGATTAVLEGTRLFRLTGSDSSDVVVTVTPATAVTVSAASGRAPSEDDSDVVASAGTLTIPRGDPSTPRYIRLRNTTRSPVNVTVTAAAPGLSIASVTPSSVLAGSPAATAVTIRGTGFSPTSEAVLECGPTTIGAEDTQVEGSTLLTSLFELPTAVPTCDVKVGGATKVDALTVTAPPVALDPSTLEPDIEILAPAITRSESDNRLTVRWTNRTDFSMPAPLITFSTDGGTLRHAGSAGIGHPTVEVLGISSTGPAGILSPGGSGQTDLIIRTDTTGGHAIVTYFSALAKPDEPYDFATNLAAGVAPAAPQAAKDFVAANGPTLLGVPAVTTVGVLERHLGDVATQLSFLGRRIADPERLLTYELDRILPDGRIDAFRSGDFGPGQPGLALPRLTVSGTGNVTLDNGETRLLFTRLPNGSFQTPPGIADVLAPNGDGYVVTSRNGSRREYSSAGLLVRVVDSSLQVTTYDYTGALLAAIHHPTGGTTTIEYGAGDRISSVTDTVGRETTFGYDGNGRLTSTTEAGRTTTQTWGADNLLASRTSPEGVTTSWVRDDLGRVIQTRVNGSLALSTSYGDDGSTTVTDALGRSTTSWRDDTGVVARLLDPAGRTTTLRRDARGNAVGMVADGAPIGDLVTRDAARAVSGLVDGAGGVTRTALDPDGLVGSVTDPDGRTTTITRDAQLRPVSIRDPLGAELTIAYDERGRPAVLHDRLGTRTDVFYRADDLVTESTVEGYGTVQLTHDARRNLLSATGPTGTTSFTYDADDRITGVTYPNGLGLTFGYDSAGRRIRTTTSDGQETTTTYDARGRMATVASDGTTVARYEYDAADRLVAIGYANGSRVETTYDVLGRVIRRRTTCCTALGASTGATTVNDVTQTYDAQDRVLTRTDAAGTTTYGYDGASRLVSAVTVGASPRTVTYTYDGNGNRLTVTDSAGGSATSTLDGAGRPTQIGAAAVAHDAEGHLTSKGPATYGWNDRNELVTTTAGGAPTTYEYDALGMPIARTTGGVTTKLLMDPTTLGWLVGEYSAAGARQAGYAWGQGLAARLGPTGAAVGYYAVDPRGDVTALTGANGAVTDTYRYLPFGEVAARTGSTSQPFTFQGDLGLRTDPNGLIDARARFYDPTTGRFLSEDPQLFAARNPATWASGDPVNRTDMGGATESYLANAWANPAQLLGFGAMDSLPALGANALGLAATPYGGLIDYAKNLSEAEGIAKYKEAIKAFDEAERWPIKPPSVNNPKDPRSLLTRQGNQAFADGEKMRANSKLLSKVGKGLQVFGGAMNAVQGWEAYKSDPTFANGVRQTSKAFLKTIAPPLIGLGFDIIEAGVDEGSMSFAKWWYRVDDTDYSGWKPKNRFPRPGGRSENLVSGDPNAIIGPSGATVGDQRFVARTDVLPYTVQFENIPTATLPADEVVITHVLDDDVDMATFELTEVGLGGRSWQAPAGLRAWTATLDDRDRSGLFVLMRAKLDRATRTVTWSFRGIDPDTGDRPADATRGFLPPNATAPQGEGFTSYRVRSTPSAPTGREITAQASIVFDGNAPIATNIDTVVVDAGAPTAAPSVPARSTNPVKVALGATDDAGGSGVGFVDVYASKDGADFALVRDSVSTATVKFRGVVGSRYRFLALPDDRVANRGVLSTPSGEVLIKAPARAPSKPRSVKVVAKDRAVAVSWTAPKSTGGAKITKYAVRSAPARKVCATTGRRSCTVRGLKNGTRYTFTVRAKNRVGWGPWSTPSAGVRPRAR